MIIRHAWTHESRDLSTNILKPENFMGNFPLYPQFIVPFHISTPHCFIQLESIYLMNKTKGIYPFCKEWVLLKIYLPVKFITTIVTPVGVTSKQPYLVLAVELKKVKNFV